MSQAQRGLYRGRLRKRDPVQAVGVELAQAGHLSVNLQASAFSAGASALSFEFLPSRLPSLESKCGSSM